VSVPRICAPSSRSHPDTKLCLAFGAHRAAKQRQMWQDVNRQDVNRQGQVARSKAHPAPGRHHHEERHHQHPLTTKAGIIMSSPLRRRQPYITKLPSAGGCLRAACCCSTLNAVCPLPHPDVKQNLCCASLPVSLKRLSSRRTACACVEDSRPCEQSFRW